jgi:hypothetical protein
MFLIGLLIAIQLPPAQATQPRLPAEVSSAVGEIRADRIRGHMAFLADDLLEGRETGTRGFDLAARYVATQFQALGLRPFAGRYQQPMTIRRGRVDETRSSLTLLRGGTQTSFVYGQDFVTYGETAESDVDVTGELVFVGDGVTVPRHGIDAYRGVNTVGKIVIALPGAPPALSPSEQSYFADADTKAANAAAHGARTLLLVAEEQIPWDLRVRTARQLGASEWLPSHRATRVRAVAYVSRAAAAQIIDQRLDQAVSRVGVGLGSAVLHVRSQRRDVSSANVYGLLPGSDPKRSSEYIVYTAHLDHLGIGDAVDGDAIYNGAVDNASGVAGLLAMAKAFMVLPKKPARSILFVATTGEELGEVGSNYLVHHPPVPLNRMVASINVDGLSFTKFEEAVVAGGTNSSLGRKAEEAARQLGMRVKNTSIGVGGSDHSPFLLAGIPALWIFAALPNAWMRTRYHTPQDDMNQALDFDAAVQYTRLIFVVGYLSAQDSQRPRWNPGELFAEKRIQ